MANSEILNESIVLLEDKINSYEFKQLLGNNAKESSITKFHESFIMNFSKDFVNIMNHMVDTEPDLANELVDGTVPLKNIIKSANDAYKYLRTLGWNVKINDIDKNGNIYKIPVDYKIYLSDRVLIFVIDITCDSKLNIKQTQTHLNIKYND